MIVGRGETVESTGTAVLTALGVCPTTQELVESSFAETDELSESLSLSGNNTDGWYEPSILSLSLVPKKSTHLLIVMMIYQLISQGYHGLVNSL